MPPKTTHTIRPATPSDLPQIIAIMNHYIAHTVISLRMDALTLTDYEAIFSSVKAQGLPFFVTETTTTTNPESESTSGELGKRVTGFAYAHGFRPTYTGYRHTAEITIYVHPSYHSQGVGTLLMDTLMGALRATNSSSPSSSSPSPPSLPSANSNPSPSPNTSPYSPSPNSTTAPVDSPPIKQVLSLMSLNEDGPNGGWGLRDWYARWGFEQIGHMKRVGFKFGRWVDVVMMQASLE